MVGALLAAARVHRGARARRLARAALVLYKVTRVKAFILATSLQVLYQFTALAASSGEVTTYPEVRARGEPRRASLAGGSD